MPRTQSHDPDLDDLPGFETADPPEPVELDDPAPDPAEPSQPASPAPETTSTIPSPPASAPESPSPPSPPTATSSEPDAELTDGLEFLAGGLFELLGQFLNRMVRVRRRQQTTLWLVTDEEAEAFAAPMARIAERRLPDELKTGDAKDLLIAGSVAVEYATHNAAGEPGVEQRPAPASVLDHEALRGRLEDPGPPQPPQAPAPPAPSSPAPSPQGPGAEAPPLVPADL